jgi:nitrile hydratase
MMASSAQPRFAVGHRVRVKTENRDGNPRTPTYIRGKTGTVAEVHGTIVNPIDHRGTYPPLYSVVFTVGEVFDSASRDQLSVDLHEEWLDPA